MDHYLDLVVRTGQRTELIDVDELLEAHQMGLVSPETAERAITTASSTIDGLARDHDDLQLGWVVTELNLSWR